MPGSIDSTNKKAGQVVNRAVQEDTKSPDKPNKWTPNSDCEQMKELARAKNKNQ